MSKYTFCRKGYTLTEIVIVMLIIAVIIAVSIGVTKRKLDSVISYTYYSAYETLKDISRSMIADYNVNDENYQASISGNLIANAARQNSYYSMLKTIWGQPVMAISNTYTPPGASQVGGFNPGDMITGGGVTRPGSADYGDGLEMQHTCGSKKVWDSAAKACVCKSVKTCTDGYIWDSTSCSCKQVSDSDEPDNPNPNPNPPAAGCSSNDTPPACGQMCVNGTWQPIAGFSKNCDPKTQQWKDLPDCKCIPVARTLPRDGEKFCELFVSKTNTKAGVDVCKGSFMSPSTTDFGNETPDVILRNGMRIYNLHNGIQKLSDIEGNKSGITVGFDPSKGAQFNSTVKPGASVGMQQSKTTATPDLSSLPVNMFMRKPLPIFPILSGLWEQPVFAGNANPVSGNASDGWIFEEPTYSDGGFVVCKAGCTSVVILGRNVCKCTATVSNGGSLPSIGGSTPIKTPCRISSCPAGQHLVNANSSSCSCQPDEVPPVDNTPTEETCPITSCPAGQHLVNANSSSCSCQPDEVPPVDNTPTEETCPITNCPAGQHLVNANSSSCSCQPDEEPSADDTNDDTNDDTTGGGGNSYNPPSLNTVSVDTGEYGYLVYVDVDGRKGNTKLWEDVYPFYITLSGQVVPLYNKDAGSSDDSMGGNSTQYLQTSIEYEYIDNGRRKKEWLAKSVSYQEGACKSGYITSSKYCGTIATDSKCSQASTTGAKCTLKTIKPVKFF